MKSSTKSRRASKLFLLQIYAYCLFDELIFIYPLYAVMFADCGLSALQISVMFTVWSLTGFILEIPSGALADRYSRKHILMCAQGMKMAGFSLWMLFPSFWGFLLGFVCWGTCGAFTSGTGEAFLYDELKAFGMEQSYAKVKGRARSLSYLGILLADVFASPMVSLGYRSIIAISLVSLLLSILALAFIRPATMVESTGERQYFALLKTGVHESVRNRMIRSLMLFICFALIVGALDEYWPILGREAGLSKHVIPLWFALIDVALIISSATAHRFEHLPYRFFYAAYVLAGGMLLVVSFVMRPLIVLLIPLFTFILTVSDVVFESRIQHTISGDARATVLSVKGFLTEAGAMPVFMGFGTLATRFGYRIGFGTFACMMLLIGLFYVAFGYGREGMRN